MALSVFAGTFNKNAGTGAQAITGVGFTPKVLILWTSYQSTADVIGNDSIFGFGFTTGAAQSHAASWSSQHNVATSNNSRRGAAKVLTVVQYGETLLAECGLTSFDADGFTLDWTTNGGGTQIVHFLALGGGDIVNQKVSTFTSPTSTGNKVITGLGFQPDLILFLRHSPLSNLALGTSAAGAQFMLGAADHNFAQWCAHTVGDDGVAVSAPYRPRSGMARDTLCVGAFNSSGTILERASLTAVDSDGFTLNYTTANTVGDTVGYLAISFTGAVKVGHNNGIGNPITGVGFQPTCVLRLPLWGGSNTGDFSTGSIQLASPFGATTGTTAARNQSSDSTDYGDAGANTKCYAVDSVTNCSTVLSSTPAVSQRALASFDADGFTLSGSTGPFTAIGLHVALADAPSGAGYVDQGEEG